MAAGSAWADYDNFVTYFIPKQTIPKLRQFGDKITQHSGINLHIRNQERKGDLVDKIRAAFNTLQRSNREREYLLIRRECEQIAAGNGGMRYMPPPTFGGVPSSSSFAASSGRTTLGSIAMPANGGYRAPMQQQAPGSGYRQTYQPTVPTLLDWKASPLWKPIKALTNLEMLPDITAQESSHTRRERRSHFQLPTDVIDLLNKSKSDPRSRPLYSVRLFCASSEYYRPPGMAAPLGAPPVTNRQVPIEYPINPDVSVDDHPLPFKDRGLRGKAGSAPPFDLDKSHRGLVRIAGRMASIAVGHTGPTVTKKKEYTKKFWYQVVFCEITPMEDLLVRLEALVPTDVAAEREKLRKQDEDDDEIQLGLSNLSLKDPLSGMRISKPVRSSKCSHLQCFDARWWLEANKSHPQWLCPHCSKELKFDEIICDGYFLSIINTVPDDYDEVVLESNGDWHTSDSKYANDEWMAAHGKPAEPVVTIKRQRSESALPSPVRAKRAAIEILSDSEDEDEPPARTNGHTVAPAPAPPKAAEAAVIDLTISDSDESDDEPPLRFQQPGAVSASRDAVVSQPRPAKPAPTSPPRPALPVQAISPANPSPTAYSDALRDLLQRGSQYGERSPRGHPNNLPQFTKTWDPPYNGYGV